MSGRSTGIRKARYGSYFTRIRVAKTIDGLYSERVVGPAGQVKREIALSAGYFVRFVGFELAHERQASYLVVSGVLYRCANLFLWVHFDVEPFGGRKWRVVLKHVVKYFCVVFAATRPVNFHFGYYAVLARTACAHDRVYARPVRSILHYERRIGANFVHLSASHASVRSTVFELQVRYFKRILVVRILDKSSYKIKR